MRQRAAAPLDDLVQIGRVGEMAAAARATSGARRRVAGNATSSAELSCTRPTPDAGAARSRSSAAADLRTRPRSGSSRSRAARARGMRFAPRRASMPSDAASSGAPTGSSRLLEEVDRLVAGLDQAVRLGLDVEVDERAGSRRALRPWPSATRATLRDDMRPAARPPSASRVCRRAARSRRRRPCRRAAGARGS